MGERTVIFFLCILGIIVGWHLRSIYLSYRVEDLIRRAMHEEKFGKEKKASLHLTIANYARRFYL